MNPVSNAADPYQLDTRVYGTLVIRRADGSEVFTLDEHKDSALALEILDRLNSPEPI